MSLLLSSSSIGTDCVCAANHLWNEIPGTLASHSCTEDSSLYEFFGAAFSLIVIMLQTNSLN